MARWGVSVAYFGCFLVPHLQELKGESTETSNEVGGKPWSSGFHILTVDFSTHQVPHLFRIAQGRAKGRHEISGLRDKESHHLPDDRRPGSRWSIWPVLQTILGTKLALRLLKYTKVLIQVLSQVL